MAHCTRERSEALQWGMGGFEIPANQNDAIKNPRPEYRGRHFEVEVAGQMFDFIEWESDEPSDTLIVHLPSIRADGEEYTENMHYGMDRKFNALTLRDYGVGYARDRIIQAIGAAIERGGARAVVFHGTSFGASVVYDLISDPALQDFLQEHRVAGAILESPILDKNHLNSTFRLLPEAILVKGASRFAEMSAYVEAKVKRVERRDLTHLLAEVLREKTTDKRITLPVHAVFTDKESLADPEKTRRTLEAGSNKVSFTVVASASGRHGHQPQNYLEMWRGEKDVIEQFAAANSEAR